MLNSDSDDSEVEAYEIHEYEQPEETQRPAEERLHIDARMDQLPEPPRDVSDMRPTGMNVTSSNTGPKGVKADFEQAKKNLRTQRMMDRIRMEREIQNKAEGERKIHLQLQNLSVDDKKQAKPKKKNSSDDSDEDDSGDEVLQKIRQQRIQAAQMLQNSLPTFGSHARVTVAELKQIVKETHELCYIVVHLYQNHIEACVRINFAMEVLAEQFPHVRFLRIRSTEAIPGYAEVGLPTLMIYRGGELITSAVRVTDALPKRFTDLDVAKLLQSKQVLTVPATYTEHDVSSKSTKEWLDQDSPKANKNKIKFSKYDNVLDDDSD